MADAGTLNRNNAVTTLAAICFIAPPFCRSAGGALHTAGRYGASSTISNVSGRMVGRGLGLSAVGAGGGPEFAVTDGAGHVFVNIVDKSELAVIDPTKLAVERQSSLSPCQEPSGLAIDRARQ